MSPAAGGLSAAADRYRKGGRMIYALATDEIVKACADYILRRENTPGDFLVKGRWALDPSMPANENLTIWIEITKAAA